MLEINCDCIIVNGKFFPFSLYSYTYNKNATIQNGEYCDELIIRRILDDEIVCKITYRQK